MARRRFRLWRDVRAEAEPHVVGVEPQVVERFDSAGIPADRIAFVRDTYTFRFDGTPSEFVETFRKYYGPTMNAFDAATKNGREAELQKELDALFANQNTGSAGTTVIPATFLRVTVSV